MKYRHFLLTFMLAVPLPALLAASSPAFAAGGAAEGQTAQPGAQLQVALTLYAGGISFGKMDMDATLRGSDYRTVSNFQTSGAVSAFWQSEIQATSSGKIGAKSLEPDLYDSYDINRTGYHDTHDTMANIDLDYGAALCAIVIESVARAAADNPRTAN